MGQAQDFANKLKSWMGKNEADGSHLDVVNVYNSIKPLPSGYKLQPHDSWCAATVSAAAWAIGAGDIFPYECSCPRMIERAKQMGIWQENDAYKPSVGDVVMYDWQDSGVGDNTGEADHVGGVVEVSGNRFRVIEGNKNDAVQDRWMDVNGRYIRGFITPKWKGSSVNPNVQTWWPGAGNANQLWKLTWVDKTNKIVKLKNVASGKFLAVEGKVGDGANVCVVPASPTSTAQQWKLVPLGYKNFPCYELAPVVNDSMRLDVAGGEDADGANVQVWSANGNPQQRWAVFSDPDSRAYVVSLKTFRALDVYKGGK